MVVLRYSIETKGDKKFMMCKNGGEPESQTLLCGVLPHLLAFKASGPIVCHALQELNMAESKGIEPLHVVRLWPWFSKPAHYLSVNFPKPLLKTYNHNYNHRNHVSNNKYNACFYAIFHNGRI